MKFFSLIALSVILLATITDTYAVQTLTGIPTSNGSIIPDANLPPIFAVGNKVSCVSKNFGGVFLINEVRGEWIYVGSPGEPHAWMHPASIECTWTQVQ